MYLKDGEYTSLSSWLQDKCNMSYEEYRTISKPLREKIKSKYSADTGVWIGSDGKHYSFEDTDGSSYSGTYDNSYRSTYSSSYSGSSSVYTGFFDIQFAHFMLGLAFIGIISAVTYFFMPWYMWFIFGLVATESCFVNFKLKYRPRFWDALTDSVLSIDIAIALESLAYLGFCLKGLSTIEFVGVTFGVFAVNFLSSFIISKKAF